MTTTNLITAVGALVDECHRTSKQHGFWQHEFIQADNPNGTLEPISNPSIIGEKLALIHSEVSEALEVARNDRYNVVGMREELADVVIRTFDLAANIGGAEEFAEALLDKIEVNKHREHLHGKAF